jgi:di/tricarboxylate transporter
VIFQTFIGQHGAFIGLVVLGAMLAGFLREKTPASAIAMIGAAAFLALGLVPTAKALEVFSNEAVITIIGMLVVSAALVRTGVLEAVAGAVLDLAKSRPRTALALMLGGTLILSAFINTTPVVIIMIPLMISLAAAIGLSAKQVLIPLSYTAVLAGTCTLIGTSTNLLVDALAQKSGQAPFGIFEITPVGLVTAAAGASFMLLFGRFLLPKDRPTGDGEVERPAILTELRLGEAFPDLGKAYSDIAILKPRGVQIVSVHRRGERLDHEAEDVVASLNDRLVLRVTATELATLRTASEVTLGIRVRNLGEKVLEVARVTLMAGSRAIGRAVPSAPFLSHAPVGVIGASRYRHLAGPDLQTMKLRAGDRLWLTGSDEALAALGGDPDLIVSGTPLAKPFRRNRAAIAIGVLVGVVVLAAFGVMPIAGLALIATGLLFLARGIDAGDAWAAIDIDLIFLIFGMLIVGTGLQHAGSVDLVVRALVPYLIGLPPFLVILAIYALTSTLTELISNSAVAVIFTPLAIGLAETLGIDTRILLITVMFGASASFATPIGYQTNTLVYNAGDYRFTDFLKVGVPMNIFVGLATCTAIYLLYMR